MTIKEYFEQKQPISNTTIGDTCFYKDVATITIQPTSASYATIEIAHIGENLWAFGYKIKPNSIAPIICKDCTTHATTRGHIENLVYGMIQVLLLHLKRTDCTKSLKCSILEAAEEAMGYCKRNAPSIGKITL